MPPRLIALLFLALAAARTPAGPFFAVNGQPPERIIVTVGPALLDDDPPLGDMARALLGVRAVHTSARDLRAFNAALGRLADAPTANAPPANAHLHRTAAHLHLIAADAVRTIELVDTPTGDRFARDTDSGQTSLFNAGALRRIEPRWATIATPPSQRSTPPPAAIADLPLARVVDLPPPYTPSPITLDVRTLGDRFFRGRGQPRDWPPMDRDLADERFSVRLPKGFTPDRPAGLLVWQSPSPRGDIPQTLHAAADALGLICIGAHNAGNFRGTTPDRPQDSDPADRFQLCLDAVATAHANWWIDTERTYITGLSGGGRISGMFWHCVPDVFRGAVPMVGLNSQHRVAIRPGFVSPPGYMRPAPALRPLTATQRLAAITGTEDYNGPEMVARIREFERDRRAVRLWNIEGMGHTFPTPEVFTEAMTWVDEPVRTTRTERIAEAAADLKRYTDEFGDQWPPTPAARERLLNVTRLAPWTKPAWTAAEILGLARPVADAAD